MIAVRVASRVRARGSGHAVAFVALRSRVCRNAQGASAADLGDSFLRGSTVISQPGAARWDGVYFGGQVGTMIAGADFSATTRDVSNLLRGGPINTTTRVTVRRGRPWRRHPVRRIRRLQQPMGRRGDRHRGELRPYEYRGVGDQCDGRDIRLRGRHNQPVHRDRCRERTFHRLRNVARAGRLGGRHIHALRHARLRGCACGFQSVGQRDLHAAREFRLRFYTAFRAPDARHVL